MIIEDIEIGDVVLVDGDEALVADITDIDYDYDGDGTDNPRVQVAYHFLGDSEWVELDRLELA